MQSIFSPQPDGGIDYLGIDLLVEDEEPRPLWQVRNMHYFTWDYGQVQVQADRKFKLLLTAMHGDNNGKNAVLPTLPI